MFFKNGQSVVRERQQMVASPANPARLIPAGWDVLPLDVLTIAGASVASSSSALQASASRSQILTEKSLFVTDVSVDVLPGDRVRYGSSVGYVRAMPEADVNPFTGWQPVKEIPLEEVDG
jgi:hypothetical protein